MSPVKTLERPQGLLCAQDLRPLHLELLQAWNDLDDKAKWKKADAFRRTAAAAGEGIKSLEERDSVQSMIDYWTATMATVDSATNYPSPLLVAEFSEQTVQKTQRECPYVGLNAFEVRDHPHYFGRESDVDAVIAAFQDNAAAVIHGASGTGKTSLAQAGVVARLAAESGEWLFLGTIFPGRDPLGALLQAVRPAGADRGWIDEHRTTLMRSPKNFRDLAETRLEHPEQRLLLLIDRAEELFASDVVSSEISAAAGAIAALIVGPALSRHRVLFTIRDDFVDKLERLINESEGGLDQRAYHQLTAPSAQSLRDAIVKPGDVEGFKFDDQVVEDLVAHSLDQPDSFPLLQFALTHLWNRAEVDRVSWADYQMIPKPSQMIADLGEETFGALPSDEAREVARLAFTEMIRLGQEVTFRRVRREDLEQCLADKALKKGDLNAVLNGFVNAGLMHRIPAASRPDDRFELSHSAVIRHWPRLLVWIGEKRTAQAERERYTVALERWRSNGRSWRYLLPASWLYEARKYRGISRALDEYITASRQWWGWLAALVLGVLALWTTVQRDRFGALWDELELAGAEKAETKQAEIAATSQAREEGAAAADLRRQGLVGDQTLLRMIEQNLLSRDQLPEVFLERLRWRPSTLPRVVRGYDEQFLASDPAARVPMPRVSRPGTRWLTYPHTTVLYDTLRRLPIVVATNVDMTGKPLPPFSGVGFFPDPRVAPHLQSSDRVSPVPTLGRVSLIDWRQAGWAPPGSNARDATFLSYQPLSVLQPWKFYDGLWSMIDRRLFPDDSKRFTILTGPILSGNERIVAGSVVPNAYWKAAIHWDEATKKLAVQAFAIRADAPLNAAALPNAITTPRDIARRTGLHFGWPAESRSPQAVAAPVEPTVYLQFAVMPRATALQISRKLADGGYHLPPEEEIASARNLAEVRYVRDDDAQRALVLAQKAAELLKELGFGEVRVRAKHLTWVRKQPPPGTLELWLGLSQPNTTFEVHEADDGFLALRSLPSVKSELLVKMPVGERVECGPAVEEHPGWRPCVYEGLSGYAFNRYLKPAK